ncbi:MAG: hypothetical protein IJZ07_09320 [Clostridia bacterium]|nr:hypothetical protein [Clostridia bacterium]
MVGLAKEIKESEAFNVSIPQRGFGRVEYQTSSEEGVFVSIPRRGFGRVQTET